MTDPTRADLITALRRIEELTQKCEQLSQLALALDKLLCAYRVGGRPSEKTLHTIGRLRQLLLNESEVRDG